MNDSTPSAVRGGALLLASGVIGNLCNYLFAVLAGRILGPADYGVLTALLALAVVVALPVSAIQVTLARDVAYRDSQGDLDGSNALLRTTARAALIGTAALAVVSIALMVPVAWLLNIDDVWLVGLTALIFLPLVLTAVVTGEIQARQRYGELAVVLGAPSVSRLFIFGASLLIGATLVGALWASVIGSLVGLALPAWWARNAFRRSSAPKAPLRSFTAGLWPVVIGMIGVTALTNIDLLVVKGRLSAFDAGLYGAASVLDKIAFFVPTAIVAVLFPRVAMRRAEGRDTRDILGRALVVTIAFCLLLFGFFAIAGQQVVDIAFGSQFAGSVPLLVPMGIGMTCFSVANVLVSFHLSSGDRRYASVLAIGAAVQLVALLLVPAGLMPFIWVNAGIGIALLIAHEVIHGSSLTAIAMGARSLITSAGGAAARAGRRQSRRATEVILALAGFTALAILLTWPLAANMGSATFGPPGDSYGAIHWLWSLPAEGGLRLTGTSPVDLTGFPFGWERSNGVNAQWILIYGPAYFLSTIVGPVAAYNLVVISGLALSGAAMYWLARYIGTSPMVAIWAGVVFTMFPWLIERAQYHGSLVHLEWFPVLVIAILAWRRRPDATRAVLVGGSMLLLWLTSGYYGLIGLLIAGVLLVVAVIAESGAWGWLRGLRRAATAYALALAAAAMVFAMGLLGGGAGGGAAARGVEELDTYGARWWEWLLPPGASRAFGTSTGPWLLERQHGSNTSETGLYVGWITIALALGWVAWRIVRRHPMSRERRYLIFALPALAAAGLLFSLPHPLSIAGVEVPSPAYLIYSVAPQFRVSSRMIVVVMLALVPMAAIGLEVARRGLTRRLPDDGLRRASGVAGVGMVCVASAAELTVVPGVPVPSLNTPPEYAALASVPNGAVAEYPMTGPDHPLMTTYLLWQTRHRRPLVNGAPGNTFSGAIRGSLGDITSPGTASQLAALGATAVVVRPPASDVTPAPTGFRPIFRAPDGVAVWQVVATPSAVAALGSGFGPPEDSPGRAPNHWLSARTGEVVLWAPKPTTVRARFTVSSWQRPRLVSIAGSGSAPRCTFTATAGEHAITIGVPAGFSLLGVSTSPGPALLPDGRPASIYMSSWSIEPVTEAEACTTARPASPDRVSRLGTADG